MSYTKFSTERADYFLVYGNHISTTDEDILRQPKIESLDAIILESGNISPQETLDFSQYSKILDEVKNSEKKIPLYLVDVGLNVGGIIASFGIVGLHGGIGYVLCKKGISDLRKRKSRRDFIKGGVKALLGTAIMSTYVGSVLNGSLEGEPIPVLPELIKSLKYLPPTPMNELRNAITARKTEEFVAPRLKKEKGKKPLIALVYGALHAGIETDLKHKWLRDAVIDSYKAIDYLGIKKEQLNVVWEMDPKEYFRMQKHKVDLF